MAITRAQQAKQMLQDGGRIGLRFGSEGYQGGRTDQGGAGPGPGNGGSNTNNFGDAFDYFSDVNISKDAPTTSTPLDTVTPLSIDRDEINRIRNRRFAVERPTLGMTLADLARGSLAGRALTGLQGLIERSRSKRDARFPGEDEMAKDRIAELIDQQRDESDDSQIVLPIISKQEPIITEDEDEKEEPFQLSRLFRAEGGIINSNVVGGEMDFESARQMYGLGKLVKKVTRTVKKIAKSPVGKIAISAAILGTPFGAGAKGTGFFGPKSLFGRGLGFLTSKQSPFTKTVADFANERLGFNAARTTAGEGKSLLDMIGGKTGLGIIGASAVAGALTPEEEEQIQLTSDNTGIDPDAIREAYLSSNQYRARAFRAEGGSMKEPVAKKTMPLLDLDGKEMDLRAEGGFVPIGRMEKADDVPARLSKNEFVFTADAVRNAGDGNVDKGAEVMYNMMKNLEAGGDVSEESQGLEGARRMFQTSKRLEEVL